MAQRYLTAVSYGKSLLWLFAFWALAPLLVWFAVFLAKRKSGWGICGSSWLVCGCFCRFVMICLTTLDQVCPCTNVFENVFENCLFSCKDRASERRRPYQRKKKPSSMHCKLCPKKVWLSASSVRESMLAWEKCNRGVPKILLESDSSSALQLPVGHDIPKRSRQVETVEIRLAWMKSKLLENLRLSTEQGPTTMPTCSRSA
jgi:hypothetical protein